jgi:CubicO group peptidase (beta-lactamase class C family)
MDKNCYQDCSSDLLAIFDNMKILSAWCARLAIISLGLVSCSSVPYRTVRYNFSDYNDFKKFPARNLSPSPQALLFKVTTPAPLDTFTYFDRRGNRKRLDKELKSSRSLSFIVLKGESIVYEKYFGQQNSASLVQAFSMTKSFTSLLTGCALDDGYIQSVEQPVTDFVPELKAKGFGRVQIRDLLNMTSGIDYRENGNPFGIHNKFYYTSELEKNILRLRLHQKDTGQFEYRSGDIALLGLILKRALAPLSLTEYMQKKIWTPLGMENGGLWTLDHEGGLEKTWCCLAGSARDYLKIGQLYLHEGNGQDRQLVSKKWIGESLLPLADTTRNLSYHYNWWIYPKRKAFVAVGKGGQYLYIKPEEQVIVLRLGKSKGKGIVEWFSIFDQTARHFH